MAAVYFRICVSTEQKTKSLYNISFLVLPHLLRLGAVFTSEAGTHSSAESSNLFEVHWKDILFFSLCSFIWIAGSMEKQNQLESAQHCFES